MNGWMEKLFERNWSESNCENRKRNNLKFEEIFISLIFFLKIILLLDLNLL